MAGIDKIYGTTKQRDQFYTWCCRNTQARMKKLKRYFYPRDGYENNNARPITNFPERHDKWLLKNCPLEWVTDYIKMQYGLLPWPDET